MSFFKKNNKGTLVVHLNMAAMEHADKGGEAFREGKLDEAVAKFHEALEADASFALAHSALAVVYGKLDKHDDAIQHGLKVCELEPNDPFSFTAMSVTYVRAGRIPEAEEAMARAHQLQASG